MPDRQPKPMSVVPPSPPWAITRTSGRPRARFAAATPDATAAALPNSEWIHGIRHDVCGYGVENTSRQPVALTATSRLPVACMAASMAYRAPSASPHPWHARCPELSEFVRCMFACTDRWFSPSNRLPTVNVPVW